MSLFHLLFFNVQQYDYLNKYLLMIGHCFISFVRFEDGHFVNKYTALLYFYYHCIQFMVSVFDFVRLTFKSQSHILLAI